LNKVFSTFGDIEELYLFKDLEDEFKGSCFIKYVTRKDAIRAILHLNGKGDADSKLALKIIEKEQTLEIRFADKKRKE
jgi:RNA recognition motif-containing protein